MMSATRSRAEIKLEASRNRQRQVRNEQENVRRQRAEHTAKLRALRLAREAAVEDSAAEETGGQDKQANLPQAHRRQC